MNFKRFHSFKKTKNDDDSLSLTQMIDKATLATNTSEDIVLFMQICKEINYEKKASKKAAEEISKRLKPKVEPQTQFLTISLLRIISENCKPFEQELRKLDFLNRFSFLWLQRDLHSRVRDNMEGCIYMWLSEYKDDLYMLKLHDMCMIIYEQEVQSACTTPPRNIQQISINRAEPLDVERLVEDPETQNIITNLQETSPSQSSRGYFRRTIPLPQLKNATDNKGKSPLRQDNNLQNTDKELDALIEEADNLTKLVYELLEENANGADELLNDLLTTCCKQHTTIIRQIWTIDDPQYIDAMTETARKLFEVINNLKKMGHTVI